MPAGCTEKPPHVSDSWRGFRGVKPLKSLRPYGTAHAAPTRAGARRPLQGLARGAPSPRYQRPKHWRWLAFCPLRRNRSTPWPIPICSFPAPAWTAVRVQGLVDSALKGADDGELFLEYSQSESFAFDDNRLESGQFRHLPGLRAAGGGGRSHRLCPRHRTFRRRHRPRRPDREGGGGRPFRSGRRLPLPAPTSSSIPTSIRCRPPSSAPRSACWSR